MSDQEAIRRLVEDIIERADSKRGEWWYPRTPSGRDLADVMVTWFISDTDFDEEAWSVWVNRIRAAENEARQLDKELLRTALERFGGLWQRSGEIDHDTERLAAAYHAAAVKKLGPKARGLTFIEAVAEVDPDVALGIAQARAAAARKP